MAGPSAVARIAAAFVLASIQGCAFSGLVIPQHGILSAVHFRGAPSVATVALTFDDGPNGACTDAVLDALAETHVPATFFVLGKNLDSSRSDALIARMVREGHAIGLHGWAHDGPPLLVAAALRRDLRRARRSLLDAETRAGLAPQPRPVFYRPPYGLLTSGTAQAASGEGFAIVLWTVSVGDWHRGRRAADVVDAILAEIGPGSVVVLHDGNRTRQTSSQVCRDRRVQAEAVRLLVPRLGERGLRVAPLAEVLGLTGRPAVGAQCRSASTAIISVGTPQDELRTVNTRDPGRRPARTSETFTPSAASLAWAASRSATRHVMP